MTEKLFENRKSVSDLIAKSYGSSNIFVGGKRGRVLHEAWSKYHVNTLKTSTCRNKINYRVFSQHSTKVYNDILSEIRKNADFELYYEDIKVLLKAIQKEILFIAKSQAKTQNYVIIPEEIEKKLFGGYVTFENETFSKVGGFNISARVDALIEVNSNKFIVRDFKSYKFDKANNPSNQNSDQHKWFMQICLYAILFEKERCQQCEFIQIEFFPNYVISYKFTDELRETAKRFAIETAFEGFEGINFEFSEEILNESELPIEKNDKLSTKPLLEKPDISQSNNTMENQPISSDALGYINTVKGKPLEIIRGKDNKLRGYLYPTKAKYIKDGHCVIVEKEDGIRIIGPVEKIECSKDNVSGETASHTEENYKIVVNPEGEFTPEGYLEVRPQTIIGGKIKMPTPWEICQYKQIPQNGIPLGQLIGLGEDHIYRLPLEILYQSLFLGGVQGTGKTNALKYLTLLTNQEQNAPSVIILDHEDEYGNLGTKHLNPNNFHVIDVSNDNYCLSLEAIDPLELPRLLRELSPITYDSLLTIIYDIVEKNPQKQQFTLLQLKRLILINMENSEYRLASSTKAAIRRALNSISLKIFDVPEAMPLNIETVLKPGRITVINTYNLKDYHQRIVGLYLCAMLHKNALKGSYNRGIVLILDEIQRIIPKSASRSELEYQKRIINFLSDVIHRGRKRNYGIIIATQSPLDVKKDIIDLCNTKIFFQIQGESSVLLHHYLEKKEERDRLKKLPIGHAFITSKGKHKPIEIKFPLLV